MRKRRVSRYVVESGPGQVSIRQLKPMTISGKTAAGQSFSIKVIAEPGESIASAAKRAIIANATKSAIMADAAKRAMAQSVPSKPQSISKSNSGKVGTMFVTVGNEKIPVKDYREAADVWRRALKKKL